MMRNKFHQHLQRLSRLHRDSMQPAAGPEGSGGRLAGAWRTIVLTYHGFSDDNCALRASALTFYSLLAVVPVVAMAFGIAKGFGFDQLLESQLYERFAGQEEVLVKVIDFARNLLENTRGGLIAGIGVAALFWSVIKVLGHIESALNHIWKVRARTFIRKFSDYLSIMLLSPLLMIISSSVNVYITSQVTAMTGKLALLKIASPVIFSILKLLPFGLIWILFILVYVVMPNTRVRFGPALMAGLVAGTCFQLLQGIYISFQILVSKYNAIYGSFAALPLFLIWLQLSWMIVLAGAELAYARQTGLQRVSANDIERVRAVDMRRHCLRMLMAVIAHFEKGDPPLTAAQAALELSLSPLMTDQVLQRLQAAGLVNTVADPKGKSDGYQPACDIQRITIGSALSALDHHGQQWPAPDDEATDRLVKALDKPDPHRLIKDI